MQDDDYYPPQQQYMPVPQNQFVRVDSKEPIFNQWFLDSSRNIENLKNNWRGWIKDNEGNWVEPADFKTRRLMNDAGIHWAGQLMESYLSNVYLYTNMDKEEMCFQMRMICVAVWGGLLGNHLKFEISKINTQVIGTQIFCQIHASLLSPRGEGIRKYLSSTQQVNEVRQTMTDNSNKGFLSGISGLFNKNRGM